MRRVNDISFNTEAIKMKLDRKKFDLASARACMSINDIAEKTGIPRPTISNVALERGTSPVTLGKIARALGVDPLDIIKETED